jgi:uncharacterized protein YbjT (DUF2867 family)
VNVIVFGASGMVGAGAVLECLADPEVQSVLAVVRAPTGMTHAKLRELVRSDFLAYSDATAELSGYDACFYCLGISSVGMTEEAYHRITHDMTVAAASALFILNPKLVFCFVSGAGTDSTEQGRSMWARVKGKAENALLRMPIDAYAFRPAFIQPMKGVRSKTGLYRVLYAVIAPLHPLLGRLSPGYVTTTEKIGRAMLRVARQGYPKRVLESADINVAAA